MYFSVSTDNVFSSRAFNIHNIRHFWIITPHPPILRHHMWKFLLIKQVGIWNDLSPNFVTINKKVFFYPAHTFLVFKVCKHNLCTCSYYCEDILIFLRYLSGFLLADQILHAVFVTFPLLWVLGVLPPLDALLFWGLEQALIVFFGGTPTSSDLW